MSYGDSKNLQKITPNIEDKPLMLSVTKNEYIYFSKNFSLTPKDTVECSNLQYMIWVLECKIFILQRNQKACEHSKITV